MDSRVVVVRRALPTRSQAPLLPPSIYTSCVTNSNQEQKKQAQQVSVFFLPFSLRFVETIVLLRLEVLVIMEGGEIGLSWRYEEDDCIVARGLVAGTVVGMLLTDRMKRSFSVEKNQSISYSLGKS